MCEEHTIILISYHQKRIIYNDVDRILVGFSIDSMMMISLEWSYLFDEVYVSISVILIQIYPLKFAYI